MATPLNISATRAARALRRTGSPTFIQRSRQVASEQKAIWHHVTGAGRSQVRRPFFDLGEGEQDRLRSGLEALIQARLDGSAT
jgi:hypothetical protein